MDESLKLMLREARILPTVTLHTVEETMALGRILQEAGYPCLEILLRSPFTWEALSLLRQHFPELKVGVGTLLTLEELREAHAAGAAFGVSPGLDLDLFRSAHALGFPYLPGISTPTELMQLRQVRGTIAKVFPAGALGSQYLAQMATAFAAMTFVPSGGLHSDNWREFAALTQVLCLSGSWILPKDFASTPDSQTLVTSLKTLRDGAFVV
ncbi:MAG: bifunctional 4-hydroxy-2-oxoglutarate aldolase/2-dehydro-3-deoxy-phosphogluconate aldolase [Oligoflexus sp.]|jgi:2-dehydro-3-deoxyphosphogluconate aldolase/(4S)-4-hydroxy-2-oxoglutarate aldolase